MVSTRSHPSSFPPPSPSKSRVPQRWAHHSTTVTILWLAISLPLVVWDMLYIFLRPHSMPGGRLHAPIWAPYKLYGQVDYVYGWPSWEARSGFTAAQSIMNLLETSGYILYLVLVFGSEWKAEQIVKGWLGIRGSLERRVDGVRGAIAVLLGFGLGIMTASKTILYFLHEHCSGYQHVGHNDATTIIFLWIIPNGVWILLPSYMVYEFGCEILQGLAIASGDLSAKSAKSLISTKDE